MINNISLEGYVSSEIVMDKVNKDKIVANFTLSVPRIGKAKEKQAFDVFFCVAWNQTAKKVIDYVSRGQLISIVGHVESGTYNNRETGQLTYSFKVIVDQVHFLSQEKK